LALVVREPGDALRGLETLALILIWEVFLLAVVYRPRTLQQTTPGFSEVHQVTVLLEDVEVQAEQIAQLVIVALVAVVVRVELATVLTAVLELVQTSPIPATLLCMAQVVLDIVARSLRDLQALVVEPRILRVVMLPRI
jgi:hypothetical protein